MNLLDLFAIPATRTPDKTALCWPAEEAGGSPEERCYSFRELERAGRRGAAVLARYGVGPGDRVALYLDNRPELVITFLAVLHRGAVAVPLNPAYRRREVAHVLEDAAPAVVVAGCDERPVLDELAAAERPGLRAVLEPEELTAPSLPIAVPGLPVLADDPALLLYTSGTTGKSKGAVLTHRNLLATVAALHLAWSFRPADRLLLTLPLFHTHGLVVGLTTTLAAGATVVLHRRFDATRAADLLITGGASLFFGVPTLYRRLLAEVRSRGGGDFRAVRLFCSGSAPLPPELFHGFRDATGHEILERYGMTETGMLLSNPWVGERRPGTVGTPLPGVSARIVDGSGGEVTPGEEGELQVRGGNVFDGYWNAPEKTAATFVTDDRGRRWFKTGDLARRDPQTGAYTLLGRAHDLILSGGFNVYPREIEEVLLGFPGVREAAVAGRPHPEWGETPVAFLVTDGPLDRDALTAHLKAQLAGYKVPRTFHVLPALPKNTLGKVEKHRLPE